MQLQFLRAAGIVTCSKYLVHSDDKTLALLLATAAARDRARAFLNSQSGTDGSHVVQLGADKRADFVMH